VWSQSLDGVSRAELPMAAMMSKEPAAALSTLSLDDLGIFPQVDEEPVETGYCNAVAIGRVVVLSLWLMS
jgi:hypothetical protein